MKFSFPGLIAFLVLVGLALTSCIHPQVAYRKTHLLDPMMDPAKTGGLPQSLLSEPQTWVEHGASDGAGAMGASCPTCGG